MATTLGGVAIPMAFQDSGSLIEDARQIRWAVAVPLGYIGRINTNVGSEPIDFPYHTLMTTAQKNSIKALADAGAAVQLVYTEGDISITRSVLIKRFSATRNSRFDISGYWDVNMTLEEQV